jgi:RNA polymerase sigma-70 factor, ECF subfamily
MKALSLDTPVGERRDAEVSVPAPSASPNPPQPDGETSFELLRRAREGDAGAEERLCARYLPRLRRWARGQLPPAARSVLDTGDIVQEVLIRALRIIPVFEPRHEGAFQGCLRLILKNKLRDVARQVRRRPIGAPVDSAVPSDDLSPLERAIGRENRERYQAAWRRLPREDRQVIFARLELGFGYDEMAPVLGRPTANAARVATRRAMIRLAKEMSRETHEPGRP